MTFPPGFAQDARQFRKEAEALSKKYPGTTASSFFPCKPPNVVRTCMALTDEAVAANRVVVEAYNRAYRINAQKRAFFDLATGERKYRKHNGEAAE